MTDAYTQPPHTQEVHSTSAGPARMGELVVGAQSRNDWLEDRLNSEPNRPLPEMQLSPVSRDEVFTVFDDGTVMPDRTPPPSGTLTTFYNVNDADGRRIGSVVMDEPPSQEDQKERHYIGDIKIIDEKQGQGYGLATYLAILKNLPPNAGLRTEGVLSPDARKMWQRLSAAGVARRVGGEETAPVAFETVF